MAIKSKILQTQNCCCERPPKESFVRYTRSLSTRLRVASVCMLLFSLYRPVNAQHAPPSPYNAQTPASQVGVPPAASVEGTAESVTLASGALNTYIPALTLPQRAGAAPLALGFVYENHAIRPEVSLSEEFNDIPLGGGGSIVSGMDTSGNSYTVPAEDMIYAGGSGYVTYNHFTYTLTPAFSSTFGSPLDINIPQLSGSFEYQGDGFDNRSPSPLHSPGGCGQNASQYTVCGNVCLVNFGFRGWDGTEHPFSQVIQDCAVHGFNAQVSETGGTSSDDDGLYYLDPSNPNDFKVIDPSGTVYHFSPFALNAQCTWVCAAGTGTSGGPRIHYFPTSITDRHGNQITFQTNQPNIGTPPSEIDITDTLQRKITIQTQINNQAGNYSISYKDSNGQNQTITLGIDHYGTGPLAVGPQPTPNYWQTSDQPPATQYTFSILAAQKPDTTSTVYKLAFSASNRQYSISFDDFWNLTKITYPTGGYRRYLYQPHHTLAKVGPASLQQTDWVEPRVSDKYECTSAVGDSGSCDEAHTSYHYVGTDEEADSETPAITSLCGTALTDEYGPESPGAEVIDPIGRKSIHCFIKPAATLESSVVTYAPSGAPVVKTETQYNSLYPSVQTTTRLDIGSDAQIVTERSYDDLVSLYYGVPYSGCCSPAVISEKVTAFGRVYSQMTAQYLNLPLLSTCSGAFCGHVIGLPLNSTETSIVDSKTRTTTNTYDGQGVLQSTTIGGTGASSTTTQYSAFDAYGRPHTITDPRNGTTTLSYDDVWINPVCTPQTNTQAFVTSVTDALNHTESFAYDTCSSTVAKYTDANSVSTTYDYDGLNRLTATHLPDTSTASVDYHGDNYPQQVTSTHAYISTSTIADGLGRTVTQILPNGASIATSFDNVGRVHSMTNPEGTGAPGGSDTTTFLYDLWDRKIQQQNPDGTTLTWCYEGVASGPEANCSSNEALALGTQYSDVRDWVDSTDEAGHHVQHASDGLGHLRVVTEPDASGTTLAVPTGYAYDGFGNLVSVNQVGRPGYTPPGFTQPEVGRTRAFQYDGLSRLIMSSNPETGSTNYRYVDAQGNLCAADMSLPCSKSDANGMATTYTYDPLNRIQTKTAPDGGENTNYAYSYDQGINGIGRLTKVENPGWSDTAFTYDVMGRVTNNSWLSYAPEGPVAGMAVKYDLAGNVIQLNYPDGRIVSQDWDGAGRLLQVYDGPVGQGGKPYISGMQYWPSGALEAATYGNQVSEGVTINNRLQPCHTVASTPLLPAGSAAGNLYDRASFHAGGALGSEPNCGAAPGNNGNIWSIADNVKPGWSQSFGYDGLNRLTSAARSDGGYNHTYNYDSFGNMLPVDNLHTPMNYGIDPSTNRLELNGDLTTGDLRYYANGELAVAPTGLGSSHSFTYTAEGYLRSIDSYGVGSYLYNGLGERFFAARDNGASWTKYIYLNGQPMADVDPNGTWEDYIYANGQKIAKVSSQIPLLHLHGTRDASVQMGWGVEGPVYGGSGAGTVIAAGDQLAYDFLQTIPSYGGLALIFDNATIGAADLVDTATNTPLWFDATSDGQWHHRVAKLDEYVGHSLTWAYVGLHNSMPAGTFDMYYGNMVILHANGTVTPIYTGQAGVSVGSFVGWNGGARDCSSGTDLTPSADGTVSTNYYLSDHLGTTQMELSSGGWPLWQGQFTPFGQEIVNGLTNNVISPEAPDGTAMRYKFTGKERDTESGLDYFGARYYASSMGRWMSPDWSAKEDPVPYAKLDNPQSLNLYGYVLNNPLSGVDADGHVVDQKPTVYVYYPVTGADANEALNNANNHFTGADGGHYAGLTTPSFTVQYADSPSLTKADGTSTVTRTVTSDTVTLTNTVQLPQWTGGTPEQQAAFDQGVGQLKAHEEQHVGDNRAAADALDKSLPGTKGTGTAPTTPAADAAAKADLKANVGVKDAGAAADMANRGAARDAATDHGKKQP